MRLIRLQGKLQEIYNAVGIDLLVFEAARNAGPKMQGALVVQSELQGVIKLWCETKRLTGQSGKIEYKGVSPTEVKKHATGKGNAGKPLMVAAAQAKWGNGITDDNEADALWILDFAQKSMSI